MAFFKFVEHFLKLIFEANVNCNLLFMLYTLLYYNKNQNIGRRGIWGSYSADV